MDNLRHFSVLRTYRGRINPTSQIRTHCECLCHCGNYFHATQYDLNRNNVKSCGCLRVKATHSITHGLTGTREYRIWSLMKDRCSNSNCPQYSEYGGRGITVCERWLRFENFIEDMGFSKPKETIERVDNNLGYCPSNCKWSTAKEQANNRRSSRIIEFNGQRKTLMQWAEYTGIHWSTIRSRIERSKWQIEKCLTHPI